MAKIINNPTPLNKSENNTRISIEWEPDTNALNEQFTIIHCRYKSKPIYVDGGWVNIWPTTYLTNHDPKCTFKLLQAYNIPIAPDKHIFQQKGQVLIFTLFFPALPKDWDQFDLIEKTGDSNGFMVSRINRNQTGIYRVNLY